MSSETNCKNCKKHTLSNSRMLPQRDDTNKYMPIGYRLGPRHEKLYHEIVQKANNHAHPVTPAGPGPFDKTLPPPPSTTWPTPSPLKTVIAASPGKYGIAKQDESHNHQQNQRSRLHASSSGQSSSQGPKIMDKSSALLASSNISNAIDKHHVSALNARLQMEEKARLRSEEESKNYEMQMRRLQMQLDEMEREKKASEDEKNRKDEVLRVLNKKNSELLCKLQEEESERFKAHEQVRQHALESKNTSSQKESISREVERLKAELENAQLQLTEVKTESTQVRDMYARQSDKLQSIESERISLQQQVRSLKDETNRLSDNVARTSEKLKIEESARQKLLDEQRTKKEELRVALRKNATLTERSKELERHTKKLEEDAKKRDERLTVLRKTNNTLTSKLEKVNNQKERINTDVKERDELVAMLSADNNDILNKLYIEEQERIKANEQVHLLQQEMLTLQDGNNQLIGQIQRDEEVLGNLREELHNRDNRLNALEAENSRLAAFQATADENSAHIASVKMQVSGLESENRRLLEALTAEEKKWRAAQVDLSARDHDIQVLEDKVKKLKKDLEAKESVREKQQQEIWQIGEHFRALKKKSSNLSRRAAKLGSESSVSYYAIQEATKELDGELKSLMDFNLRFLENLFADDMSPSEADAMSGGITPFDMSSQLRKLLHENQDLTSKYDEEMEEHREAKDQIKDLRKQLKETRDNMAKTQGDSNSMETQLYELQEKHAALLAKCEALSARRDGTISGRDDEKIRELITKNASLTAKLQAEAQARSQAEMGLESLQRKLTHLEKRNKDVEEVLKRQSQENSPTSNKSAVAAEELIRVLNEKNTQLLINYSNAVKAKKKIAEEFEQLKADYERVKAGFSSSQNRS